MSDDEMRVAQAIDVELVRAGIGFVDQGVSTLIARAAIKAIGGIAQAQSTSELHPATADLVRRFAVALSGKLRAAEIKYGYVTGWRDDDWEGICRAGLIGHVMKGDPLDVAAYAAFCWVRGWSTTPINPDHEDAFLPIFERWADAMLIGEPDREILRCDVRDAASPVPSTLHSPTTTEGK